jgi:hypothetical protein
VIPWLAGFPVEESHERGWRRRLIGTFWRGASARSVALAQVPTRLVAGLLILKHMYNPSDEALCDRRVRTRTSSAFAGNGCSATKGPSIAHR